MNEPTEHEKQAIAYRQRQCKHAFITSYRESRCVHCGVSQAEWEAMETSPQLHPWSGGYSPQSTNGIP